MNSTETSKYRVDYYVKELGYGVFSSVIVEATSRQEAKAKVANSFDAEKVK